MPSSHKGGVTIKSPIEKYELNRFIPIRNERKFMLFDLFQKKYNDVKSLFMKESVSYLDRHKVASILMASAIEADVVRYDGAILEGNVFIGKYLIAVSAGLSYMQDSLNQKLKKKGQKPIKEFFSRLRFRVKHHIYRFSQGIYILPMKKQSGNSIC